MRVVALLIVVVAALAAEASAIRGAVDASHGAAKPAVRGAGFPSWSPDGKHIAFAYIRYASAKSCCGYPPDLIPMRYRIVRTSSAFGGAVHTVLAASGWCCARVQWAAGGRILLNPNVGLKAVGVQGGKPKRLVFPSCAGEPIPGHECSTVGFILSPNREYAAAAVTADASDPHFAWGIGLVRLKAGRALVVRPSVLTTQEQDGRIVDTALAFSPDGTQLVFSRASWDGWRPGPPALLAIPVGGGGDPVPLAQSGIPGASLVPSDVRQVQWSPDGRWLAFVERENLEVVPTTGGAPRVLATNFGEWNLGLDSFSWSPTSTEIAYDCCSNNLWTQQLMTVRPDGTDLTDLLHDRPLTYASREEPQWSPDGSRLLFVARGESHRASHVWTIRPDGRDLTRVG
jgi:WD40-like Beta Propeller Repeat